MMCFLLGFGPETLARSPLGGAVFETMVFGELRKKLRTTDRRSRIFFYRDRDGQEVDFVIVEGTDVELVECKAKEIPDRRDTIGVRRIGERIEAGGLHSVRR